MDVLPKKAPRDAFTAAARLTERLETQNKERLITLWLRTAERDALDPEDSEEQRTFGHYLAMQAMGHGVGWADDHKPLTFKVPHIEGIIL